MDINNLPPEMLTEVFRYLNGANLTNATMVCKLWNNLIKCAFRWSLKLEFENNGGLRAKNTNDELLKVDFIMTTSLKFRTIRLDMDRLIEVHRIPKHIFKRHGIDVVELKLNGFRMDNLAGLAELLTFTPNLKHATVRIGISHNSGDVLPTNQHLPDLKKLKTLDVRGSDYRIIKCFQNARLTTMKFSQSDHAECSLLADFLSTQDKLTKFTVDSYSPSILIAMEKLNVRIPFRLTHLSISDINCEKPSQDYYRLMRFIESQAGTLTEIQMNRDISRSVYECVFANMTKVATLSVLIDGLPQDNDFYDHLNENDFVHTVRLMTNGSFVIGDVGNLLRKFPNVRCLLLMYPDRDMLAMAQSSSELESLYIDAIYGSSLDCVKLPNLKTLHIQYLQGRGNWNKFTKAHPLLTDLTIVKMGKASYLTTDDINRMTTNVDLQHIRLGASFVADNRFFEIIESKCPNLKVLDLEKSCISQNPGHYLKIGVLRLRDNITHLKVCRTWLSG